MPSLTATTTRRGSLAGAGLGFSAKASSDMSPGGGGVAGNPCVRQRAAASRATSATSTRARVASSGMCTPAERGYDLAVVGHEQALVCPVDGARLRVGRVDRRRLHRREPGLRRGAGGVSRTLPGADVRGFTPRWGSSRGRRAEREVPVGCFADPDAHAHGDRDPSCSVNVETGVWHCWGVWRGRWRYDAGLAHGLSARDEIDLMIADGLTIRRTGVPPRRSPSSPAR